MNISIDLNKTKAILIGNSDYLNFPKIGPVDGNLDDIFNILTDENIFGLSEKNIILIKNKNHQEIFESIIDLLSDESNLNIETLIFYYSGHGYRDANSKELFLTGINSNQNSIKISGLRFNDIKLLIEGSYIQKRIVIIDSCYSGLATMDNSGEFFTKDELNIKGTYILASSASNEKSFFDSSYRNTFFTKELISILNYGIKIEDPYISLENIFINIQQRLKHSSPQRKTNLNSSNFYICKNKFIQKELPGPINQTSPARNAKEDFNNSKDQLLINKHLNKLNNLTQIKLKDEGINSVNQVFYLPATRKSPIVYLNPILKIYRISGTSFLENTLDFWVPVLNWFAHYLRINSEPFTLKVFLDYINSSGLKLLLRLFRLFEQNHPRINVIWIIPEDEIDTIELVEDLQSLLGAPILKISLSNRHLTYGKAFCAMSSYNL